MAYPSEPSDTSKELQKAEAALQKALILLTLNKQYAIAEDIAGALRTIGGWSGAV